MSIKVMNKDLDIFDTNSAVIVNTVNCVGVMGKGIALQFKNLYPEMFSEYKQLCQEKKVQVGEVWAWGAHSNDKGFTHIINFPTKKHWRDPSEYNWIHDGLIHLIYTLGKLNVKSVSIPALGCSNGQLDWKVVKPMMLKMLRPLSKDMRIRIYAPH